MKRVFGIFEAVFDLIYIAAALALGCFLLLTGAGNPARSLAGVMALVLVCGDAFHLIPRIRVVLTRDEERWRVALGRGKQIASITMTVFYVLLWQLGLLLFAPAASTLWSYAVWLLAAVRILLCLLPQNRWQATASPVRWGIWRNIPFLLMGALVAGLFFVYGGRVPGFDLMGPAIVLSFVFYLPVVLWVAKNPKIGMLMLPKTCIYLWILALCLPL